MKGVRRLIKILKKTWGGIKNRYLYGIRYVNNLIIKKIKDDYNKKNNKFIRVNVINFYPSMNENLLKNTITWARQCESISLEDKEIILESKKSIIFNELRNMGKEANNLILPRAVLMEAIQNANFYGTTLSVMQMWIQIL